jgi:hypothetical protein
MTSFSNKKILLFIYTGLLLLAIPFTITYLNTRHEDRSRATASTTLTFSPDSSSTPIQKNTGDNIPLDIMVNPGNNLVTFVKLQIKFDNTKLALADSNPFVVNTAAFPTTVEGPIAAADNIAAAVSVGSDPTKAIQQATKLGTITLKAIGSTNGQATQVTFTSLSQALSSGPNDQAGENVLSTTTPANIIIGGNTIATPSATATPSAAPTGTTTTLTFTILLHGIGAAGDNANPGGADLSNKNPLHPQRTLNVEVYNTSNQIAASAAGSIVFDSGSGNFTGQVDLGANFPSGSYNIKVKSPQYLRKLVPGIMNIQNLSDNSVPVTALVAGDINGDNVLNIIDYNILLDCGYGDLNPLPLADPNSTYNTSACQGHNPLSALADLDDNGIINSPDYNLFLRELSVQNGD